ncbi:hypothetical protein BGX27_000969 [Mortierella sp. AM989]|nr:hypothetical protein BGX27_000969 [Mortierella sp. AM989]
MTASRGLFSNPCSAADRQVDFDDDDEDEEIEQVPAPRQTEETEEVGTPAPALPTLQDADDTTASTPAQTGEDDDEDDGEGLPKPGSHPLSQSFSEADRRPSSSIHSEITSQKLARGDKKVIHEDHDGDDEEDTDSSRPLVFTPSLETPIETQANTPQDFESMSPAPVEIDDLKREAQVEMVVKGLDQGQAEMEEEMEEVVVKEKEYAHPAADANEGIHNMSVDNRRVASEATGSDPSPSLSKINARDDNSMDMDISQGSTA